MLAKKRVLLGGCATILLFVLMGCASKTGQSSAGAVSPGEAIAGEPKEMAIQPVQTEASVPTAETDIGRALPVRFQKPSYVIKETRFDGGGVGAEDEELVVRVGADISSTGEPVTLRDIIKRIASLHGMNVSWASDVDQTRLVDVDLRAEDDLYKALENMLRQLDYFHEIDGNTIVVKYKETEKFHLGLPPRLTGTDNIKATGGNKISVDKDDDRWKMITENLDKVLGIWSERAMSENLEQVQTSGLQAEGSYEGSASAQSGSRSGSATGAAKGQYAAAKTTAASLYKGFYSIDKSLGLITVTAPRPLLEKVRIYVERVKEELYRQISIEAKILEVTLDHNNQRGIDWTNLLVNSGFDFQAAFGNGGIIYPSSGGFLDSLSLGDKAFTLVLDALNENGKTKLLSNPKISVMNGQPAMIYVGDKVTYIDKVETTVSDGVPTSSVTTAQAVSGLRLEIFATIVNNNEVILSIIPLVSEVSLPIDLVEVGNNNKIGLPEVRERTMNSIVRLRDGEMLVVGGLITNSDSVENKGVPGFEKIPGLGWLFKSESDSGVKKELVILLQPRIII